MKKIADEIPEPAARRLVAIYRLLESFCEEGVTHVSSAVLGERLKTEATNIRKDIAYVSDVSGNRGGYDVRQLKERVAKRLNLARVCKGCVVGLSRFGQVLAKEGAHIFKGLEIAAVFDGDVNLIETLDIGVGAYPNYEIAETVKRLNIEIALLAVPDANAQECADRLAAGGVCGIINLTSERIKVAPEIIVRDVDLLGEFRMLIAQNFLSR